jgi:tetratricopeptide (TPR) repeat protein
MTQRPCLSSEALADFVRGDAHDDDVSHVKACEACTRRLALLRRALSAGVEPIAEVADEVDDLVARLLAAPPVTWWRTVRENEYRRPDVARRLLSLAMDARLRDRQLAVDLAKAATTIADRLDSADVAELRFEAWKFSSAILREAGRYAELPAAFLKAAEAAPATANPELAQASVLLSRALYYAEPDIWQPKKAAALLDRAERVFAHRDAARMPALRTARAFLLFRSGDLRTAQEAFAALLSATPEGDREAYLYTLSNLMAVRVELSEAGPEIEHALALLIRENTAAGRTVQVARAHWLLGRVHLTRGEYRAAAQLLTGTMETIGDSDSSIRLGLDAIQALLLGDQFPDACTLARELASAAVALDRREPSRRHKLTSQVFAYLREAAHRQALTADLVTECAHYLDRITRQRPFEFVPPMPLTEM